MHIKMYVQVECRSKPLDQRHRAGAGRGFCIAGLLDQMRGKGAIDDTEYLTHDRRATGKQKSQWERYAQYPLTHWLMRQDLIHQQGGAFQHAPGAATGGKNRGVCN